MGSGGGGGGCFTYTYYRGALWHITTVCMYLSCPPPTAAYTHAQQLSTTYLCTWATASHIHITHTPRAWNAYCTYVYIHNVCIRMYVCMYVCLYVCMYVSIGPAFFPASLACARPTLARARRKPCGAGVDCAYISIYLSTYVRTTRSGSVAPSSNIRNRPCVYVSVISTYITTKCADSGSRARRQTTVGATVGAGGRVGGC